MAIFRSNVLLKCLFYYKIGFILTYTEIKRLQTRKIIVDSRFNFSYNAIKAAVKCKKSISQPFKAIRGHEK